MAAYGTSFDTATFYAKPNSKEDLIGEMEHKHNVRVQLQKYYSDVKTLES